MLTLNKEKMLSKEKLEKAFKLFDEVIFFIDEKLIILI